MHNLRHFFLLLFIFFLASQRLLAQDCSSINFPQPKAPYYDGTTETGVRLRSDNANTSVFTFYWQHSPTSTNTGHTSATRNFATASERFIRVRHNLSGCWGPVSKGYRINANDLPQATAPVENLNRPNNSSTTLDAARSGTEYSDPENRIVVHTARVAGKASASDMSTASNADVEAVYYHYDGLGRLLQTVEKGASPSQKDVVQAYEYDNLGRMGREFLPYATSGRSGSFQINAQSKTFSYYHQYGPQNVANSAYPYAQTQYDNSPLNRPVKRFKAGEEYIGSANGYLGQARGTAFEQRPSTTKDAVQMVEAEPSQSSGFVFSGHYPAGALWVEITENEDEQKKAVFTNRAGQVVLEREFTGNHSYADTYSVYNALGRLAYTFPPEAVARLEAKGWNWNAAGIEAMVFKYEYDGRGRNTVKKLPNEGEQHFVYDPLDRVVLSQDAVQRQNNEWTFFKYDALNRLVMQGIYHGRASDTQGFLQAKVNDQASNRWDYQAKRQLSDDSEDLQAHRIVSDNYGGEKRYVATETIELKTGFYVKAGENTNNSSNSFTATINTNLNEDYEAVMGYYSFSFPRMSEKDGNGNEIGHCEILEVIYYDSYDFSGNGEDDTSFDSRFNGLFNENNITPPKATTRTQGLLTARKVKVMDGSEQWRQTTLFYDDKGRLIQEQKDNPVGGKDVITSAYNFSNEIILNVEFHENPSAPNVRIIEKIERDHRGRVIRTKEKLPNTEDSYRTVSEFSYNEIGQPIKKKLGKESDGTWLQTIDYDFDIQGQLKRINNASLSDEQDLFGMELFREKGFANSQYSGRIAGVRWKSASDQVQRSYGYHYDKRGQLVQADFAYLDAGSNTWKNTIEDYSVFGISYDLSGNIRKLNRQGVVFHSQTGEMAFGDMDRLSYTYSQGQLTGLHDTGDGDGSGGDFYDPLGASRLASGGNFRYNANGALVSSYVLGLKKIDYNHLHLATRIESQNGSYVRNVYDSRGNKLRKEIYEGGEKVMESIFSGRFTYQDGKLSSIAREEGQLILDENDDWQFEYYIRDHIGNMRLAFRKQVDELTATMEVNPTAVREKEEEYFEHLPQTRVGVFPRTGVKSAATWGRSDQRWMGPATAFPVRKGDKVNFEAFARYKGKAGSFTRNNSLATVDQAAIEQPLGEQVRGFLASGVSLNLAAIIGAYQDAVPHGYLRIAIVNEQGEILQSSIKRVTTASKNKYAKLSSSLRVNQNGYAVVFVANESQGTDEDVFFDDLKLTHEHLVTREEHQYPFGLMMAGISRSIDNPIGKVSKGDLGLGWQDLGVRQYHPALARFHAPDPLADWTPQFSTYHYAQNEPIGKVDVWGALTTSLDDHATKPLETPSEAPSTPRSAALQREVYVASVAIPTMASSTIEKPVIETTTSETEDGSTQTENESETGNEFGAFLPEVEAPEAIEEEKKAMPMPTRAPIPARASTTTNPITTSETDRSANEKNNATPNVRDSSTEAGKAPNKYVHKLLTYVPKNIPGDKNIATFGFLFSPDAEKDYDAQTREDLAKRGISEGLKKVRKSKEEPQQEEAISSVHTIIVDNEEEADGDLQKKEDGEGPIYDYLDIIPDDWERKLQDHIDNHDPPLLVLITGENEDGRCIGCDDAEKEKAKEENKGAVLLEVHYVKVGGKLIKKVSMTHPEGTTQINDKWLGDGEKTKVPLPSPSTLSPTWVEVDETSEEDKKELARKIERQKLELVAQALMGIDNLTNADASGGGFNDAEGHGESTPSVDQYRRALSIITTISSVTAQGKLPTQDWNPEDPNYSKSIFRWAPVAAGVTDGVVEEATEITQAISFVGTMINDEQQRNQMLEALEKLSVDDFPQMIDKVIEGTKQNLTHNNDAIREHAWGKLTTQVLSAAGGIKTAIKAGSGLWIFLLKKGSRRIKDVPDNLRKALDDLIEGAFEELDNGTIKVKQGVDEGKLNKFFDDYENNSAFKQAMDEASEQGADAAKGLVGAWKILDDAGLSSKRINPNDVRDLGKVLSKKNLNDTGLSKTRYNNLTYSILDKYAKFSKGKRGEIPKKETMEKLIRHQENEWSIVYKSDGKVNGIKEGDNYQVAVPKGTGTGMTLTHNHPEGLWDEIAGVDGFKGASFSSGDISVAEGNKLKEIRAVSESGGNTVTFSLKKADGSNFSKNASSKMDKITSLSEIKAGKVSMTDLVTSFEVAIETGLSLADDNLAEFLKEAIETSFKKITSSSDKAVIENILTSVHSAYIKRTNVSPKATGFGVYSPELIKGIVDNFGQQMKVTYQVIE